MAKAKPEVKKIGYRLKKNPLKPKDMVPYAATPEVSVDDPACAGGRFSATCRVKVQSGAQCRDTHWLCQLHAQ